MASRPLFTTSFWRAREHLERRDGALGDHSKLCIERRLRRRERRQRCACGVGEGVGCEGMAAATAEVVAAQAAVEAAEAALAVKTSKSRSWQCTP